jgi:hypothetical protein
MARLVSLIVLTVLIVFLGIMFFSGDRSLSVAFVSGRRVGGAVSAAQQILPEADRQSAACCRHIRGRHNIRTRPVADFREVLTSRKQVARRTPHSDPCSCRLKLVRIL